MARTTQYVGLTRRAECFVAGRQPLPCVRTVEGTCGEPVRLREWEANGEAATVKLTDVLIIREVVQAMPWSCGAMIFSCLEVEYNNGERVQFHQWTPDPEVAGQQFHKENGTYWV